MDSQIKTYSYPSGELQKVQLVRLENWKQLEFLGLHYSTEALDCFAKIYRRYLVPACPWLFGNMVMFHIPEDLCPAFPLSGKHGVLSDPLTAAAAAIQKGVRFVGSKPVFRDGQVKWFWQELQKRNCLQVIRGKLPVTTPIPVGELPGFLSEAEPEATLKVNAPFFIMDRFDCATVYDHVGTPLGLRVRNGVVENPPLFRREALLVKQNGSVVIEQPDIRNMTLQINGKSYRHSVNATVYSRPGRSRTPNTKGIQLVIVGCRVVAVCQGGSVRIPASGFVLAVEGECTATPGDSVAYQGMEDVLFGIQVGNSIVKNGEKTLKFVSRFYNIRRLEPIPFPPSLYPMNFQEDRAARIALGADREGRPMLLWAEGAPKVGYTPGKDSRGASLSDMADICSDLGMFNAVNLDGGGSAQLLLKNKRALKISDRNTDGTEAERPIPLALMVR